MEEVANNKPKNVFTNKNFVLAFLGAFVSNMGAVLYSFAVSFYILSITDNNALIQGIYLAVGGVTFTISVLIGGVIGDRFHKGKIMYICDYLRGGAIVLFTILLMTVVNDNTGKIVILFILAVVGNIIGGIFSPASASLLPHIVPEESFQQAQSYYSLMSSLQGILGIILAGILYSLIPINVLFMIVGGCYIVSAISEMFIKYNYEKREDHLTLKGAFKDLGDGFKYLKNIKPILYAVICVLFVNFFISPIFSNFEPYFIASDLAESNYLFNSFVSPQMWGAIIEVAMSIGSIIVAIVLSTKQKKEKIHKQVSIAFAIVSAILALITLFYILYDYETVGVNFFLVSLVSLSLLLGGAVVAINIPFSTTLLTVVEKDKLGKVNSLIDVGSQGLIPLSNLLGGLFITYISTSSLLIMCVSGFVLITIIIITNKQIRTL